jgi:hypothetical protein
VSRPSSTPDQLALPVAVAREVSPASEYAQRWHDRHQSFRGPGDTPFNPRAYRVTLISQGQAKRWVEANHYSGTYPSVSLAYGLLYHGRLRGVATLGVPGGPAVLHAVFPMLAPSAEALELNRFVLADAVPRNGETWMLSQVFHHAASTGRRGIVAHSDPCAIRSLDGVETFPGHIGRIYQARSAAYLGRTKPRTVLVTPDGQVLDDRALSKVRNGERGQDYVIDRLRQLGAPPIGRGESGASWLPRALRMAGVFRLRRHGKHRYVFLIGTPTDRRVLLQQLRRLQPERLAYPKTLC